MLILSTVEGLIIYIVQRLMHLGYYLSSKTGMSYSTDHIYRAMGQMIFTVDGIFRTIYHDVIHHRADGVLSTVDNNCMTQ